MDGVFLKEGEQVGLIDPETGGEQLDRLEDEREFDTTEIERKVTAPDSNRKIIEEIKKYALEHEQRYGRFPKTLIFAANDIPHVSHADQLVNLCRDVFGRGERSCRRSPAARRGPAVAAHPRVPQPAEPGIVVTVDMLSTGVDIPALEFIVFLRPVKSRILLEQMLGRGTRQVRGPHPTSRTSRSSTASTARLLEYFKKVSAFTVEPPDKPSRTVQEIIEAIWQNRDRPYNVRCLVKRLQRIDKEMSGEARELFAAFIPDGDVARFARELAGEDRRRLHRHDEAPAQPGLPGLAGQLPAAEADLRRRVSDRGHGDLAVADPRRRRQGIQARGLPDRLRQVRAGEPAPHRGRPHPPRPTPGLEHRRPDRTAQKLATTPERFTLENLEKAHAARYHKELVDIISMVKHAAKEEEPLLTAPERVERAFARITAGRQFSEEQEKWLDRIRDHLVVRPVHRPEDFDECTRPARLRRLEAGANVRSTGSLTNLIVELNAAMAA